MHTEQSQQQIAQLNQLAQAAKTLHLKDLFEQNADRFHEFSLHVQVLFFLIIVNSGSPTTFWSHSINWLIPWA